MNSDRLALAGTYTSRQDIPHYNMNPYSNVLQASIVENGVGPGVAAVAAMNIALQQDALEQPPIDQLQ